MLTPGWQMDEHASLDLDLLSSQRHRSPASEYAVTLFSVMAARFKDNMRRHEEHSEAHILGRCFAVDRMNDSDSYTIASGILDRHAILYGNDVRTDKLIRLWKGWFPFIAFEHLNFGHNAPC